MSKPILFVCKSCNSTSNPEQNPSMGHCLLDKLKELNQGRCDIREEECMWMCENACIVAVAKGDHHTYLFTNLSGEETAEAILDFAKIYDNSKGKYIPFKKISSILQSANIARIPPI